MSLICNRPSSFPICLKDYNQIYDANEQKYQRPYVCKHNGNAAIGFAVMFLKKKKNPQKKMSEEKARECLETFFGNTHLCTRVHAHTAWHTCTLLGKGWRIQSSAGWDTDANVKWLR